MKVCEFCGRTLYGGAKCCDDWPESFDRHRRSKARQIIDEFGPRPNCKCSKSQEWDVAVSRWLKSGANPTKQGKLTLPPSIQQPSPALTGLHVWTVAAGENATALQKVTDENHRRYAKRIGAKYHVLGEIEPGYRFGEGNKWQLANHSGDRNLFLDVDLVLRDSCPNLFDIVAPGHVGIHCDMPFLGDQAKGSLAAEFAEVAGSQTFQMPTRYRCFNTGVVVYDDPALWSQPHRPFPAYHCTEQHLFELRLKQSGLPTVELDWQLNCQWWWQDFAARARDAHIVHLANAPHDERMRIVDYL